MDPYRSVQEWTSVFWATRGDSYEEYVSNQQKISAASEMGISGCDFPESKQPRHSVAESAPDLAHPGCCSDQLFQKVSAPHFQNHQPLIDLWNLIVFGTKLLNIGLLSQTMGPTQAFNLILSIREWHVSRAAMRTVRWFSTKTLGPYCRLWGDGDK